MRRLAVGRSKLAVVKTGYRADIDSMRAIAVLAVLLVSC